MNGTTVNITEYGKKKVMQKNKRAQKNKEGGGGGELQSVKDYSKV